MNCQSEDPHEPLQDNVLQNVAFVPVVVILLSDLEYGPQIVILLLNLECVPQTDIPESRGWAAIDCDIITESRVCATD